ncbi:MAG: TnpV protein [Eubacterium sp.]|nr:TnpV protein [Eubacterium sp.]
MDTIEYQRKGNYLLPNITVPEELQQARGKYALLRRKYLQEQRYGMFITLLTQGKLNHHLTKIQQEAQTRMEQITAEMAQRENVTEKLKAENQMLWVGKMNNIRQTAEETVMKELIYN